MDNLFNKYKIVLNDEQKEKFSKYYNLLIFYNEKFNITAITDKEQVYIKHFIDSLLGNEYIKGKMLIDIGSGGGFPAIPLAIVNKDVSFTLLEATGKKCEFLKTVVSELKLDNVKVINGRAEEFAFNEKFREKFDLVSARAVAELNMLCEYCLPFIKVGGKFISYKGDKEEEILNAENAIKTLGAEIKSINKYNLEDAKRTIIEIEKIKSTDKKYPRSNGKIRKNPL